MTKQVELEVLENIGVLANTVTTDNSPLSQVLDELGLAVEAVAVTDLSLGVITATTIEVLSSTGSSVILPAADCVDAGLMTATHCSNIMANVASISSLTALTTALNTEVSNTQIAIGVGSGIIHMGTYASLIPGTWDDKAQTAINQLIITALEATTGGTDLGVGTVSTSTVDITSTTGTDVTIPAATDVTAGVLGSNDKEKLDFLTATATIDLDALKASVALNTAKVEYTDELVDDRVATLLTAGTNVTLTYDDGAGTLTIDAAAASGITNLSVASHTGSGLTVASDTGTDAVLPSATDLLAGVMPAGDKEKVDFLTVTGAVDLDTIASDTATNNGKVSYPGVGSVDHDQLDNFLPDEHIDWTSTASDLLTTGDIEVGSATVNGDILVTGDVDGRDISVDGGVLDALSTNDGVQDSAIAINSAKVGYSNELVDDRVAALIVGGTSISSTYDDGAGTLTLDYTGSGGTTVANLSQTVNAGTIDIQIDTGTDITLPTATASAAGLMSSSQYSSFLGSLLKTNLLTVTGAVDLDQMDTEVAANTLKLTADATNVNAAGAVMESDYTPAHGLMAQQSGTGSPSMVSLGTNEILGRLSGGGSAIAGLTAAEVRTMVNVADGATANSSDAALLSRSNHTGTQTASTISDFDVEVGNNSAVVANTAKNSYPSGDSTKVGHLSVTAPINLDNALLRSSELKNLSDVATTSPSNGWSLIYSSGTGEWTPTPAQADTNLSVLRTSASTTVQTDGSGTDASIEAATASLAGVMTAANWTKLDGIETAATADQSDAEILAALATSTFEATTIGFTGVVDKGTQATTTAIDWTAGNHQKITVSGDYAITFSAPPTQDAAMLTLRIAQDATGGRATTLPTMLWPRGVAPVLSTGASAVDLITIMWDGTSYYANAGQGYA